MITYSVQQIADMLGTNPETVRRWIRDKKMSAIQVTRKDGNIVTDAELQRFLKASPKYMPRFTASIASGLIAAGAAVSIPVIVATLVGGKVAGYVDEKKKLEVRIRPEDIEKYLSENIALHAGNIAHKRAAICQLEDEIHAEEQQLEKLQYLLEHRDLFPGVDDTK